MTSKLLVSLAAFALALAQETTAQLGRTVEGVTVGDLGSPNDSLTKVPNGGAVPPRSYILEVASGSGDGIYPTATMVKVRADPAPAGQQFAGWAGDIAILSNPLLPTTTAIMPSMDVSLSATYVDPERAAWSQPAPVVAGERESTVALSAAPIGPPQQPVEAGDVRIDRPRDGGTEIRDGGPGDTSGSQGKPDGTIDPDDFQHRNIAATLDLTTLGAGVITGLAASGNGTFFSTVALGFDMVRWQGNLLWDNPSPTFVTSDRTFTIELSDAIFNELEGHRDAGPIIDAGEEGHAVVRATITQTASSAPPAAVPDTGSTVALLGLSFVALAFARSRLMPAAKCPSKN